MVIPVLNLMYLELNPLTLQCKNIRIGEANEGSVSPVGCPAQQEAT